MGSFLSRAERNCFIAAKQRLGNFKSRWDKIRGGFISNITLAMANSVPRCCVEMSSAGQSSVFWHPGTFSSLAPDEVQITDAKT